MFTNKIVSQYRPLTLTLLACLGLPALSVADDIETYLVPRVIEPSPNVLFLIDNSGSMQQNNRIDNLKQAFRKVLTSPAAQDANIAVMTFGSDGGSGIVINPLSGFQKLSDKSNQSTQSNGTTLINAIDQLQPNGGTPVGPALYQGARWFTDGWDPDLITQRTFNIGSHVNDDGSLQLGELSADYMASPMDGPNFCAKNRIVLMTDGSPNFGLQENEEIRLNEGQNENQNDGLYKKRLSEKDYFESVYQPLSRAIHDERNRTDASYANADIDYRDVGHYNTKHKSALSQIIIPILNTVGNVLNFEFDTNLTPEQREKLELLQVFSPTVFNAGRIGFSSYPALFTSSIVYQRTVLLLWTRRYDTKNFDATNRVHFGDAIKAFTRMVTDKAYVLHDYATAQLQSILENSPEARNACDPLFSGMPLSERVIHGNYYEEAEHADQSTRDNFIASNEMNYTNYENRPTICLAEIASYLANNDLRPDRSGNQQVNIDTVAFETNEDSAANQFLSTLSEMGKGIFTSISGDNSEDSVNQLVEAFSASINMAQSTVERSFNAPVAPLDFNNPSAGTSDTYVPFSLPESRRIWLGNVKKYTVDAGNQGPVYAGKDGQIAIDEFNQFVGGTPDLWSFNDTLASHEDTLLLGGLAEKLNANTSRNIWTNDENNSLVPLLDYEETIDVTSQFEFSEISGPTWYFENPSSEPVKISELVLHPSDNSTAISELEISVKAIQDNILSELWDTIAGIRVGGLSAGDIAVNLTDTLGNAIDADRIFIHARSSSDEMNLDSVEIRQPKDDPKTQANRRWFVSERLDETNNTLTYQSGNDEVLTTTISKMGAPLHTKPIVVKYDNDSQQAQNIIYLPTSEGVLHAFDERTGEELWGFMPNQFLSNIDVLRNNVHLPTITPPEYGIDSQPYYFEITDNGTRRKMLVFGMRRGGSEYFGLDITNPLQPSIAWHITPESAGFDKLGQSWATPHPAPITVDGQRINALVFGGGYDPDSDERVQHVDQNGHWIEDSVGDVIYFVDALTGELKIAITDVADKTVYPQQTKVVHVSGNGKSNGIRNGIVAQPAHVNYDADSDYDRFYFADTGGHVYRVDFSNEPLNNISATIMAELGGSTKTHYLRFFNAPTIARTIHGGKETIAIAIGSGDRSDLRSSDTQDKFFSLIDKNPYKPDSTQGTIQNYDYSNFNQSDTNRLLNVSGAEFLDPTSTDFQDASMELASKSGWYINLSGARVEPGKATNGEKVINQPRIINNVIYFGTYADKTTHASNSCLPGSGGAESRLYAVNLRNGASKYAHFDQNDGGLAPTISDRSTLVNSNGNIGTDNYVVTNTIENDETDDFFNTSSETLLCFNGSCQNIDNNNTLYGLSWEVMGKY